MASRCQLYLSMPAGFLGDPSLVEGALAAAGAPSLLVVGEGAPERLRAIVAAAHRQNATILTDNPEVLASVQGFDGIHLNEHGLTVHAARDAVGADHVVGVDCRLSRHEAMTLGEAGIDYIAFGRDGGPGGQALDDLAEIIDWWSALIEIPCAAHLSADADETAWRKLVAAGADFMIPGLEIWDEPQIIRERLERLAFYCGAEAAQAHL